MVLASVIAVEVDDMRAEHAGRSGYRLDPSDVAAFSIAHTDIIANTIVIEVAIHNAYLHCVEAVADSGRYDGSIVGIEVERVLACGIIIASAREVAPAGGVSPQLNVVAGMNRGTGSGGAQNRAIGGIIAKRAYAEEIFCGGIKSGYSIYGSSGGAGGNPLGGGIGMILHKPAALVATGKPFEGNRAGIHTSDGNAGSHTATAAVAEELYIGSHTEARGVGRCVVRIDWGAVGIPTDTGADGNAVAFPDKPALVGTGVVGHCDNQVARVGTDEDGVEGNHIEPPFGVGDEIIVIDSFL